MGRATGTDGCDCGWLTTEARGGGHEGGGLVDEQAQCRDEGGNRAHGYKCGCWNSAGSASGRLLARVEEGLRAEGLCDMHVCVWRSGVIEKRGVIELSGKGRSFRPIRPCELRADGAAGSAANRNRVDQRPNGCDGRSSSLRRRPSLESSHHHRSHRSRRRLRERLRPLPPASPVDPQSDHAVDLGIHTTGDSHRPCREGGVGAAAGSVSRCTHGAGRPLADGRTVYRHAPKVIPCTRTTHTSHRPQPPQAAAISQQEESRQEQEQE